MWRRSEHNKNVNFYDLPFLLSNAKDGGKAINLRESKTSH